MLTSTLSLSDLSPSALPKCSADFCSVLLSVTVAPPFPSAGPPGSRPVSHRNKTEWQPQWQNRTRKKEIKKGQDILVIAAMGIFGDNNNLSYSLPPIHTTETANLTSIRLLCLKARLPARPTPPPSSFLRF
eukprot:768482-Hanusia_phi.AAC.5